MTDSSLDLRWDNEGPGRGRSPFRTLVGKYAHRLERGTEMLESQACEVKGEEKVRAGTWSGCVQADKRPT